MANDEIDGHLINSVDPVSGKTPLHLAALRGSKACAALAPSPWRTGTYER